MTARTGKTATANELVIRRTFDAPRELVWRAWTDREQGWTEAFDRLAELLATM
jgi:hypothetical protein